MRRLTVVAVALVACSSAREPARERLPIVEAEHARGLSFLSAPTVQTTTREAFAKRVESEITDEEVTAYRTIWARLGYLPADFDVRAATGADLSRVAAFYDPDAKAITTFSDPSYYYDQTAILVHELVHALQDQHFDLNAIDDSAKSTDEGLALRAIVEGDARLAEARYSVEAQNDDPFVVLPSEISTSRARVESEFFLSDERVPALLSAYASFTYSFGSIVVAKAVGLHDRPPRWVSAGADARRTAFDRGGPTHWPRTRRRSDRRRRAETSAGAAVRAIRDARGRSAGGLAVVDLVPRVR